MNNLAYATVLALFLGVSSATQILGWTFPKEGMKDILNYDFFKLRGVGEIDVGYGTVYKGVFDDTVGAQYEQYGVKLYSYLQTTWDMEVAKNYQWHGKFEFQPVYIEPYTQVLYWTRPEGSMGEFHVYAKGTRTIKMLDYTTTITENSKTTQKSVH